MHLYDHVTHWGSWFGTGLFAYGTATGDAIKSSIGLALAIGFSLVSAAIYAHQLIFAGQLRREAAREKYRREQELAEAQHKAALDLIARGVIKDCAG